MHDEYKDDWIEWKRLVLSEIEKLNATIDAIKKNHQDYLLKSSLEISRLKIFAAITGAVSGGLASILVKEIISRW